ncbi:MAG: hypothetical protein Q9223_005151 [Gallowayella weberi]
MLLTLCLLICLSVAHSWAQSCSLASFDRCGPANQKPGTKSTCNATITSGPPSVYTVNCQQDRTIRSNLNKQNCLLASTDICNKITDPFVQKNQWIWSNPAYLSCALGFWLPAGANATDAAPPPDWNRCMYGIFQPMTNACTNPTWNNIGSVNIVHMPNSTTTGQAVDSLYPSYVVAPIQAVFMGYGLLE